MKTFEEDICERIPFYQINLSEQLIELLQEKYEAYQEVCAAESAALQFGMSGRELTDGSHNFEQLGELRISCMKAYLNQVKICQNFLGIPNSDELEEKPVQR